MGCGTRTSKYSKISAYSARLHQVATESNEKAVLVCHFWNSDDAFFLSWQSFLGLVSGIQRQSCWISHFLDDLESQCRSDQHSFTTLILLFNTAFLGRIGCNWLHWTILNIGGCSNPLRLLKFGNLEALLFPLTAVLNPPDCDADGRRKPNFNSSNSNPDQLFWLHFPCGKNKKPELKHNHQAGRLVQVSCLQLISHKMWMRFFSRVLRAATHTGQ